MSRIRDAIAALEAERTEIREHLSWLENQIKELRAHHREAGPTRAAATTGAPATTSGRRPAAARPARRATRARRAGTTKRPTTARSAGARASSAAGETVRTQILAYLAEHPSSTAGEIAKGTGLNRNTTATRLTRLAKTGEIKKQTRGYSAA